MALWRYAGGQCDPNNLLSVASNTWHTLRLDYFGGDGGKWVYYVDDIVRYIEAPGRAGALMLSDPRVAFVFAGGNYQEYAEGTLQPVRVWTGDVVTQTQTERIDGYSVNNQIWYAQEILSPGDNVARARLFFGAAGQSLVVSAFTDGAGSPGTLINETSYTADRSGYQDVPLWVPTSYPKIWLVVRGQTAATSDVGTSAPGSDPNPGQLLVSSNAGASWSVASRDLAFTLYSRSCQSVTATPLAPPHSAFALHRVVPNPSGGHTVIRYDVPHAGPVSVSVLDIGGRLVRKLLDAEPTVPGAHQVIWDSRDERGRLVASGVYAIRLVPGDLTELQRVIVVR